MWRGEKVLVLVLLLLFWSVCSLAQEFDDRILIITGAADMEALDEETAEKFAHLRRSPVEINRCSRLRLQASGLFTPYQAASLAGQIAGEDARERRSREASPIITFSVSPRAAYPAFFCGVREPGI